MIGRLDDLTGRVADKTSHTAQLRYLRFVTAGSGVRHHPDRVELAEEVGSFFVEQLAVDLLFGVLPRSDGLLISVLFAETSSPELLLDVDDVAFRLFHDGFLALGDVHIEDTCGDRAYRRIFVAQSLYLVENDGRFGRALIFEARVDDPGEFLLSYAEIDLEVELLLGGIPGHEMQILRDRLVEDDAAHGRVQLLAVTLSVDDFFEADIYLRLQFDLLEPDTPLWLRSCP